MAQAAPLFRLLYRSRQAVGGGGDVAPMVEEILQVSAPRNRAEGVTGMLLVIQGHFIQALEGKADAVRTTYARISMDARHSDPHIIWQGVVEQRLFGEWSMCAKSLSPAHRAILAVLDGKPNFKPQALTAESAQRLLTTVADIERRTAVVI